MLRNPHDVTTRTFVLRPEPLFQTIHWNSSLGRAFGECNTNRDGKTSFCTNSGHRVHENDAAFENCFTGANEFTVKAIEGFEIQ
jgi:hypothetical protein